MVGAPVIVVVGLAVMVVSGGLEGMEIVVVVLLVLDDDGDDELPGAVDFVVPVGGACELWLVVLPPRTPCGELEPELVAIEDDVAAAVVFILVVIIEELVVLVEVGGVYVTYPLILALGDMAVS